MLPDCRQLSSEYLFATIYKIHVSVFLLDLFPQLWLVYVDKFAPKQTVCASQLNLNDIYLHLHGNASRPMLLIDLGTPCDMVILVR